MFSGAVMVMICHECNSLSDSTLLPLRPPSFCHHRYSSEMSTLIILLFLPKHSDGASIQSTDINVMVKAFYCWPQSTIPDAPMAHLAVLHSHQTARISAKMPRPQPIHLTPSLWEAVLHLLPRINYPSSVGSF